MRIGLKSQIYLPRQATLHIQPKDSKHILTTVIQRTLLFSNTNMDLLSSRPKHVIAVCQNYVLNSVSSQPKHADPLPQCPYSENTAINCHSTMMPISSSRTTTPYKNLAKSMERKTSDRIHCHYTPPFKSQTSCPGLTPHVCYS